MNAEHRTFNIEHSTSNIEHSTSNGENIWNSGNTLLNSFPWHKNEIRQGNLGKKTELSKVSPEFPEFPRIPSGATETRFYEREYAKYVGKHRWTPNIEHSTSNGENIWNSAKAQKWKGHDHRFVRFVQDSRRVIFNPPDRLQKQLWQRCKQWSWPFVP